MAFEPNTISLLCPARQAALWDWAKACASLNGDFVECGVYKGGSALILASVLKEFAPYKTLHLFDSWSGLGEPDEADGKIVDYLAPGHLRVDIAETCATLRKGGFDLWAEMHVGPIDATLPQWNKPVSFAHLDLDHYQPTRLALEHLWPHLAVGSCIIVDDFSPRFLGIQKAIGEFYGRTDDYSADIIKGTPDDAVRLTKIAD